MEKNIKSFSEIINDIAGATNSSIDDKFKLMVINQLIYDFLDARGCEVSVINLLSLSDLVRTLEVDVIEGVKTA